MPHLNDIVKLTGSSAKSIAKMLLQSRCHSVSYVERGHHPLVIMGNGPSLAQNIADDLALLRSLDTLAVNFAANAPEFADLRPNYYLIADPHFFNGRETDPNVAKLFDNLEQADWQMTLFIPAREHIKLTNPHIRIERFNFVGIEGFGWIERFAFDHGLGMPRPRNVLIPAIMTGILAGYREIRILGADHSWLRTLSVDDHNTVVSIQPHFYKDSESERERVTAVYKDVRLHDILLSFHIAFRSYHAIASYAARRGIKIINATPGSFIDAFPRGTLTST